MFVMTIIIWVSNQPYQPNQPLRKVEPKQPLRKVEPKQPLRKVEPKQPLRKVEPKWGLTGVFTPVLSQKGGDGGVSTVLSQNGG